MPTDSLPLSPDSDAPGPLTGDHRFQLLVNAIKDYAIYLLDEQGRVISWNTGAQRLKGYTADEIIGQHFSRFYTPEDIDSGLPERALATALPRENSRRRVGASEKTELVFGRACISSQCSTPKAY